MNAYPLFVRDGNGNTVVQGTGWFLRSDLVVTAFHVVGDCSIGKWTQSAPGSGQATFWLGGLPPKEIPLFPGCFDASADVALLKCAPVASAETSKLTADVTVGEPWLADGYPGSDAKVRRVTGKITAIRDDGRLELFIEQETNVTWQGMSGTAVRTEKGVAGILTDEVPHANTLEATSFGRVARLVAAWDALKRDAGLLDRMHVEWQGDVNELRTKLANRVELPKLIEALRVADLQPAQEHLAIRIVAGIADGPNLEARQKRLGQGLYGVAFDWRERALYVSAVQDGIHRIRPNSVPEAIAKEVFLPGQLVISSDSRCLYVPSFHTHAVYRIRLPNCEVDMVAGNGTEGFSGDGGPPLAATFRNPRGVAAGDFEFPIYVADTGNHRIRRVWNTVETIAGNGTAGYYGDHGPAQQAQLCRPTYLALGERGSYLFFSDSGNHCIRKIRLADGEITTVAGTGRPGFSVDGAAAATSPIENPRGLAVTLDGLYFVEGGCHRIRHLDNDGILSTVAGNGQYEFSGDCRDARLAELLCPMGLCYEGVLYIVDGEQVKVVGTEQAIYNAPHR